MPSAPPPLRRALDRARTDWLAGDPTAWGRYADCLARLDAVQPPPPRATAPRPTRRPRRRPRGLA